VKLVEWNGRQIEEALSELYRCHFWLSNCRDPIDDQELILYYIENKGAIDYREDHSGEQPL